MRALLFITLIRACQYGPAAAPAKPAPDPGLDPTVLPTRVMLTNEYTEPEFDASRDTTKLNLSYGLPPGRSKRPFFQALAWLAWPVFFLLATPTVTNLALAQINLIGEPGGKRP